MFMNLVFEVGLGGLIDDGSEEVETSSVSVGMGGFLGFDAQQIKVDCKQRFGWLYVPRKKILCVALLGIVALSKLRSCSSYKMHQVWVSPKWYSRTSVRDSALATLP